VILSFLKRECKCAVRVFHYSFQGDTSSPERFVSAFARLRLFKDQKRSKTVNGQELRTLWNVVRSEMFIL